MYFLTGRHAQNHRQRSDGQPHCEKDSGQKERTDQQWKCKKNETMSFTLKHSSYISLVNVEGNNFKKLDIIV